MEETLVDEAGAAPRLGAHRALTQLEIDQQVFDLYDEYCHGGIDRRQFLKRSAAVCVGGLVMAQAPLPRYTQAQTISFTNERIKATFVNYASLGGNSGQMRGYLVKPAGAVPFPTAVVIHENRGLNPYIGDVARRLAVERFLALAPNGLFPVGGYPGNDDDGRAMQSDLGQAKLHTDMQNSARYLQSHKLSNGTLGAIGFCLGGGVVNWLATAVGRGLRDGVPTCLIAARRPRLRTCRRSRRRWRPTMWRTRCTRIRARSTGSTTIPRCAMPRRRPSCR